MKKIIKRSIFVLTAFLLLFFTLLYLLGPGMILHPYHKPAKGSPTDYQLPFEKISVTSFDSTQLKGYWVHSDTAPQRPVIILLHGIGNNKESWLGTADWLWKNGFSAVLIDLRAHGESGGANCCYGFNEKRDIAAVTDMILARDSTTKVGIWGHSLGGAVALQSLAYDQRLKFGVIESTFSDFRQIVYDYQRRLFKVAIIPLADNAIARAAETAHFVPDSIRPGEAAKRINCPVFMSHGDQDEKIKYEYGKQNFAQLASADKQFYTVKGGHHSDIFQAGGPAYMQEMMNFLNRQK